MNEPKDSEDCVQMSVVREAFYDCVPEYDWDIFCHVLRVRHAQFVERRENQDRILRSRQAEEEGRLERQVD